MSIRFMCACYTSTCTCILHGKYMCMCAYMYKSSLCTCVYVYKYMQTFIDKIYACTDASQYCSHLHVHVCAYSLCWYVHVPYIHVHVHSNSFGHISTHVQYMQLSGLEYSSCCPKGLSLNLGYLQGGPSCLFSFISCVHTLYMSRFVHSNVVHTILGVIV